MSERNRKSRNHQMEDIANAGEGKIFLKILLCGALIMGFMFFKDTPFPNGKTPTQYARSFMNTTVNLEEVIAKLKNGEIDDIIPASGIGIEQPPSPTPSPTPTPAAE